MAGVAKNVFVIILVVSVLSSVCSKEYSETGTSIDYPGNIYFFPSTFWLFKSVNRTTFSYEFTFPKSHGDFSLLLFQDLKDTDSFNKTCMEYTYMARWSMTINTNGATCWFDHYDQSYNDDMYRCSGAFTLYNLHIGKINQFAILAKCEKKRIVLSGYSVRIENYQMTSSKPAIQAAPLLLIAMVSLMSQFFM